MHLQPHKPSTSQKSGTIVILLEREAVLRKR